MDCYFVTKTLTKIGERYTLIDYYSIYLSN